MKWRPRKPVAPVRSTRRTCWTGVTGCRPLVSKLLTNPLSSSSASWHLGGSAPSSTPSDSITVGASGDAAVGAAAEALAPAPAAGAEMVTASGFRRVSWARAAAASAKCSSRPTAKREGTRGGRKILSSALTSPLALSASSPLAFVALASMPPWAARMPLAIDSHVAEVMSCIAEAEYAISVLRKAPSSATEIELRPYVESGSVGLTSATPQRAATLAEMRSMRASLDSPPPPPSLKTAPLCTS